MTATAGQPISFWDEQLRLRRRLPFLFLPLFLTHCAFFTVIATGLLFCLQFLTAVLGALGPVEGRFDIAARGNEFMRTVFHVPSARWVATAAVVLAAGQLYMSLRHAAEFVAYVRWKIPEPLDPNQRRAMNIVEEMAIAHGITQPSVRISRDFGVNALAVADGGESYVIISEGAISRLSRDALQALVAHAVAQIELGDARLTTGIVAISRAAAMMRVSDLDEKFMHWGSIPMGFLLVVPAIVVSFFAMLTSIATSLMIPAIAVERKFLMDAGAVQLTRNPAALVEAIEVHLRHRRITMDIPMNVYGILAVFDPGYRVSMAGYFGNLFQSHPPVEDRIARIEAMAPDAVRAARERWSGLEQTARASVTDADPIARYMVEHDGAWSGPYSLSQIAILGWIDQSCRVTAVDAPDRDLMKNSPLLGRIARERDKAIRFPFSCPRCGAAVLQEIYEGVKIGRCSDCAGVILNEEKLGRIRFRSSPDILWAANEDFIEAATKPDDRPTMECPKCSDFMKRKSLSGKYSVQIDTCPKCKMVYLDFGELEILRLIHNVG